jgi:hypothetical protein
MYKLAITSCALTLTSERAGKQASLGRDQGQGQGED